MVFPWAAAIQAGASIFSSIFGGKKSSSRVNYKQMVADATAAGFNPLTALRNGGAAGYTSTSDATPFASRLAEGLSSAADTFFQNYNPMEDKTRELGYQVMQQQLANLQAQAPAPHKTKFGGVMVREAPARQEPPIAGRYKPLPASAGNSQTPTVETPTVTNPWPGGWGMVVDPNVPDASAWEDRYGETLSDWVAGPVVALSDLWNNRPDLWGWLDAKERKLRGLPPRLSNKSPRWAR